MSNLKLRGPKVGFFSDIHIGLGQDSAVWHSNILEFARWVTDFYSKHGINEIIIPGDIFHNRNEISVNTLNKAKEFFDLFKDFKVYISTGNHDCYYKDRSDVNSISLLGGWNNIVLVDKTPQVLTIHNSDKTLSLIPWGTSVEDIPVSDICVGHFEIKTFRMNTYKECEHGMESNNLLAKSPFIISGHFHRRAFRTYEKGSILYLGSPYQQNFGDVDDIRGVYIFDLATNEFEFIPNNITPIHLKISLQELQKGNYTSKFLKEKIPNNLISLVIDTEISAEKISLISSKLQNLKPKFFRVDYQNFDNTFNLNASDSQYDHIDIPQNMEDFIKNLDVNHKEDVVIYLNELYQKIAV